VPLLLPVTTSSVILMTMMLNVGAECCDADYAWCTQNLWCAIILSSVLSFMVGILVEGYSLVSSFGL
jgi:hypothetical protein